MVSNQYHFLTFISLHWSIWSSTKGYTTLVQDTSLTQRGTFLILNFSTRSAACHHRRCGATVAAVTPPLHTAPDHCCSVLHLTLDQFDSTAKGRSLAQYDISRIFHMIFIQSFVINSIIRGIKLMFLDIQNSSFFGYEMVLESLVQEFL